jgi:hypothetical protein
LSRPARRHPTSRGDFRGTRQCDPTEQRHLGSEALPSINQCNHANFLDIEKRDDFDRVCASLDASLSPTRIFVWNAAFNGPQPVSGYDPEFFDRRSAMQGCEASNEASGRRFDRHGGLYCP